MLIAEQNARRALELVDVAYVLQRARSLRRPGQTSFTKKRRSYGHTYSESRRQGFRTSVVPLPGECDGERRSTRHGKSVLV
jgi:hypothetical protein